jgi:hypothetical protein
MFGLTHLLTWLARRSPVARFRARQRRRLAAVCKREGCSNRQAEAIAALAFGSRTYGVTIAAVEPRRDAAAPHVDRQRDAAPAHAIDLTSQPGMVHVHARARSQANDR